MSASQARRFLSRQTTCRIGSAPTRRRAMATETLEACACAAVLSVALTASAQRTTSATRAAKPSRSPPSTAGASQVRMGSSPASTSSRRRLTQLSRSRRRCPPHPPPSNRLLLGRTGGGGRASGRSPALAAALARRERPARRAHAVAAGERVQPGRLPEQPVVDRRAQLVEVLAPGGRQERQRAGTPLGLHPHAPHRGHHLAASVLAHPAAGAVAQPLGAGHRARQTRVVEDTLAAHLTAEQRPLHGSLDGGERSHCPAQAAARARRASSSSFARFVAPAASEA